MKLSISVVVALSGLFLFPLGCGKSAPSEPDQVITQSVEALKASKPATVYAMLPASYQKDVQGIVTEATSKLDKEVFELGVKVLDKAMAILDKHGDMLAGMLPPGGPVDGKGAIELAKQVHGLLKDAGLTDFSKVQKLDVAAFLSDHGEKLMKFGMEQGKKFNADEVGEFEKMLVGVTAKTLKTEGDAAEVEVTAAGKTETVKFVKVEERWVPADMAEGWKAMIDQAKAGATEGMEEFSKNKEETKKQLEMVLGMLDAFEKNPDLGQIGELMKNM